jgi:hypothetical protein
VIDDERELERIAEALEKQAAAPGPEPRGTILLGSVLALCALAITRELRELRELLGQAVELVVDLERKR